MYHFRAGAAWGVVICVFAGGDAFGQSFKQFQYTPSPAADPYGGPSGSGPQDYFRRQQEAAQDAARLESQKMQEKLDKEAPWLRLVDDDSRLHKQEDPQKADDASWLKSFADFQAPTTQQYTVAGAVLLFSAMGGILLWVGAGSLFRKSAAAADAAKRS